MPSQEKEKPQVLVSACCLGLYCRYHGRQSVIKSKIQQLREKYHLVPVCPEQLGGLPTPRPPCYWVDGKLQFIRGKKRKYLWDLMQAPLPNPDGLGEAYPFFLRGAEETLRIALALDINKAFFLRMSPSCDPKEGICSKLLTENGIKVTAL